MRKKKCKIDKCENKYFAKDLCQKHYTQHSRGRLGVTKEQESHGLSDHELYNTWGHMKFRCYNKSSKDYPTYGGIGITVCEEWINSFATFLKDMGERPVGLTLERLNNDLGYSKGNCKWATKTEQSLNRRLGKNNTSGYAGVFWNKWKNKWQATIKRNNKQTHIGYFVEKNDAIKARKDAEDKKYE